jgi:histone H3/H4
MSGRRMKLLRYFLENSPVTRYRQFSSIITTGTYEKYPPPVLKTDSQYVNDFLDRLEVLGPAASTLASHIAKLPHKDHFGRIFPQLKVTRTVSAEAWGEPEQLMECIRLTGVQGEGGVALHQELEQRLQVASPGAIAIARNKLLTLFKLLLKRREALPPGSLEHEAALSLSRAALDALSKAKARDGQDQFKLGELEAMEKLLVAREYQREGMQDMAMNGFEEICRNRGASAKTRMEALKVLCSCGEEHGDASVLESLVTAMQGEQQYEEMLQQTIRKIKDRVGG